MEAEEMEGQTSRAIGAQGKGTYPCGLSSRKGRKSGLWTWLCSLPPLFSAQPLGSYAGGSEPRGRLSGWRGTRPALLHVAAAFP